MTKKFDYKNGKKTALNLDFLKKKEKKRNLLVNLVINSYFAKDRIR